MKRYEKNMIEYFDVLNSNGEYTNKIASREECHEKRLWHKAVVFMYEGMNVGSYLFLVV